MQKIRILPLGDSITYGQDFSDIENPRPVGDRVAYRFPLYRMLKQAGFDFSFIGNKRAGYNYFTEANNAGFPGCSAAELYYLLKTGYNQHDGKYEVDGPFLEHFKPDVILLYIGTNRVNSTTSEHISSILDQINAFEKTAQGNTVTTFLARIINGKPANRVISRLNLSVDKMVKDRLAADSAEKIIRVDMENILDYDKDMADMAHPNPSGYEKIAQCWFDALDGWIKAQHPVD